MPGPVLNLKNYGNFNLKLKNVKKVILSSLLFTLIYFLIVVFFIERNKSIAENLITAIIAGIFMAVYLYAYFRLKRKN